jgi:putative radical SAM enzyme (TIGR03279 family)
MIAKKGIRVLEIAEGSAAEDAGLVPGDRILSINGHEVPDELALRFYLSEESVDLYVQRANGSHKHFKLDLEDDAAPGILLEEFRTLTCNNACLFCFVDQLPPGVRPALRVKDDDYRLSFLHGNYITLTNLTEKHIARIVEQRLSPLYVSIHATDPDLRTHILGRKKPDNLAKKLSRLVRGGIRLHTQIVLMPGINDGLHLKKTVFDLYALYPGVQSIALVPVGLSDHGNPRERLNPVTPAYCRTLIRETTAWQDQFRKQTSRTFICLADEFYLQGKLEVPEQLYYDDFAQIEDGIGMVRDFLDQFEIELRRRRKFHSALQGTLVTGRLFYPTLQNCIKRWNPHSGSRLNVRAALNRFMGKNITVAGLLAGSDILAALHRKDLGDFVIIPGEALSSKDRLLVDNFTLQDLSDRLGKPVYSSGRTVHDFFKLLSKLSRRQRPPTGT